MDARDWQQLEDTPAPTCALPRTRCGYTVGGLRCTRKLHSEAVPHQLDSESAGFDQRIANLEAVTVDHDARIRALEAKVHDLERAANRPQPGESAAPAPTCGSLPCYRPGAVAGEGICTKRNVGARSADAACVLSRPVRTP